MNNNNVNYILAPSETAYARLAIVKELDAVLGKDITRSFENPYE